MKLFVAWCYFPKKNPSLLAMSSEVKVVGSQLHHLRLAKWVSCSKSCGPSITY